MSELKGVLNLLIAWRERGDSAQSIQQVLPAWLTTSFAPELTRGEKDSWLSEWRQADYGLKKEMESRRGWEFAQWTYWFSRENEMWQIESIDPSSLGGLTIFVRHIDDVFPYQALEWLVGLAEGTMQEPSLI